MNGNEIVGKYFELKGVSLKQEELIRMLAEMQKFRIAKEIFRGTIYDKDKVGSIIFEGQQIDGTSCDFFPAVLKVQFLKPEIEEVEMMGFFQAQNKCDYIRVPRVINSQRWTPEYGFGFTIMEKVDGEPIFKMPYALGQDMTEFCRFYQMYRKEALTKPWFETAYRVYGYDSLSFVIPRITNWLSICRTKTNLPRETYMPLVEDFVAHAYDFFCNRWAPIPMFFSHGHLTANDIYKCYDFERKHHWVLMSNLFWGYRPQWYDLAFNIWNCLMHITDDTVSVDNVLAYVDDWLAAYRKNIRIIEFDDTFDRKIRIMLMERCIGAIVGDLGCNDERWSLDNCNLSKYLVAVFQKLYTNCRCGVLA